MTATTCPLPTSAFFYEDDEQEGDMETITEAAVTAHTNFYDGDTRSQMTLTLSGRQHEESDVGMVVTVACCAFGEVPEDIPERLENLTPAGVLALHAALGMAIERARRIGMLPPAPTEEARSAA